MTNSTPIRIRTELKKQLDDLSPILLERIHNSNNKLLKDKVKQGVSYSDFIEFLLDHYYKGGLY